MIVRLIEWALAKIDGPSRSPSILAWSAASALCATVASLALQRMFGSHIALIAVGPLLAVLGYNFYVRIAGKD